MKSPAIIIKSEFTYASQNQTYNGYLKYISRKDAKEKKEMADTKPYVRYLNYMDDNKKNGQLFSDNQDFIVGIDREELEENYRKAEQVGSPLWKDVISFDNEWLEEQGLYKSQTNWLNETKLKNAVREAMQTMIKDENMLMPVWSASFHYNTDNIHVHIATVDLDPSKLPKRQAKDKKTKQPLYDKNGDPIMQYRGKRKPKTLKNMKSKVASRIIDRTPSYRRIDELIRDNAKKLRVFDLKKDKKIEELFYSALENMPENKKEWRYGYSSVDCARPYIDELTDVFMETYYPAEREELIKHLDEQVMISKSIYGNESESEKYKDNKIKDFKSRLGNALLDQLKDYNKETLKFMELDLKNRRKNKKSIVNGKYIYNFKALNKVSFNKNKMIYLLDKAMRKTFHEYEIEKNISEFDRMLEGYEI